MSVEAGTAQSLRDQIGTDAAADVIARPRRLGVWALAIVSVSAGLVFLAWRMLGVADGGLIPFYADAWRPDGVVIEVTDASGGLQTGDVVETIAGRSVSEWIGSSLNPMLDRSAVTDPGRVDYTVSRAGEHLEVTAAYRNRGVGGVLADNWANLLFATVMLGVGLYVLWRRPDLSASVALVVAGCGVAGSILPWLLGLQTSDIALGWPFVLYTFTATAIYMLLWPAGALHLPLAMAGQPSRRTLSLVYGMPLGAFGLAMLAGWLLTPSATAWLGTWPTAQGLVAIPCVIVGLLLAVRLYVGASPDARRQVLWATVGAAVATIVSLVLLFIPELVTGRPLISWNLIGLVALPLPIGIAVGILRYRLFEIDVVVNRTLVYGGATLAIVVIYAATVIVVGAVLPPESSLPASLLATGLAAVAALPIRDALQRGVNRLMYGDRDDPYRALSRLGRRLEASLDPLEAPQLIVTTVAESLRLPWVGLQFSAADGTRRLIQHGQRPPGDVTDVPLVYNAEVVGDLLVARGGTGRPLTAADAQLLEALARQSGAAVHAIRLTRDLIESRERLVAAREEERRRIRRDLHDGLGPSLAAIKMRAEAAAELATRDAAGAAAQLEQVSAEVGAALADVRRLVDGLRPPTLDELGLVGAIEAQAARLGHPPRFEIVGTMLPYNLPAAVEVAAFRIAVEGMTNASRHASAGYCRVELRREHQPDEALRVEIADDGHGLPAELRPGIGLSSMRERAAEVGGTLELGTSVLGGASVTAVLPISPSDA